MRSITQYFNFAKKHIFEHKPIYIFAVMLFVWTLFDSILAYITPVAVLNRGFSPIQMGLIMGCSSAFGAFFDFILSKFFRNTTYRRLFLFMFLSCAVYPLLLWKAQTLAVYWIAMAFCGLYYDLKNFGICDFVTKHPLNDEKSSTFGFLDVFRMLAYLVSPTIAGLLIAKEGTFAPYGYSMIFLSLAFVIYIILLKITRRKRVEAPPKIPVKPVTINRELKIWGKVGVILMPMLLFDILLNIFDATFWTIGPIYAEQFPNFPNFGGLFITIYMVSILFTGLFVGKITSRFGQKKTAFVAFIISAALIATFGFIQSPFIILGVLVVASLIGSVAWPASSGAYADYISESKKFSKEIIGVEDFNINIGYFIGPIIAGVALEYLGAGMTFTVMGTLCAIGALVVYLFTPKEIKIKVKESELPKK